MNNLRLNQLTTQNMGQRRMAKALSKAELVEAIAAESGVNKAEIEKVYPSGLTALPRFSVSC